MVERTRKHLQGADGGALTSCVGIEGQDDVAAQPLDESDLLLRDGGSHRGDDIRVTKLVRGNCIHVALDDNDLVLPPDGLLSQVESEEEGALVEDHGLGRVEIFRHRVAESAATEADDATLPRADGEEEAIAEPVAVAPAISLTEQSR